MRFGVLLAAVAAFWVQPTQAVVYGGALGIHKDLTLNGGTQRWDFRLLSELPPGAMLHLPAFNQYFTFTSHWTENGTSLDVTVDRFAFETRLDEYTPTSWSITYTLPGQFNVCDTKTPKIGDVCRVGRELWANASWIPATDPNSEVWENTGFLYDLTITPVPEPATWALMILGVGAIGVGLRRNLQRNCAAARADGVVLG